MVPRRRDLRVRVAASTSSSHGRSASEPRRSRCLLSEPVHGISTSPPWRRRDSSADRPRRGRGVAASRLQREYPRASRGVAASRLQREYPRASRGVSPRSVGRNNPRRRAAISTPLTDAGPSPSPSTTSATGPRASGRGIARTGTRPSRRSSRRRRTTRRRTRACSCSWPSTAPRETPL